MKWIGQHIYDLTSRFRSDVYLEDISTGTIASGAHLGLDSNNKIVKAADGGGDLTSIVAGTGLSGTSLTGPVPTLNVDASQTQITGVGTITTGVWNSTAIASAYLDADTAHLTTAQTFTGSKTMGTNVKLNFRDGNANISSPTANDLEIVATDITLDAATSVKIETSDLTMYDPVNDGNPTISLGSSATNRFEIKTAYNSGAQTLDEVYFNTYTQSSTNNDGRYIWQVDEVELAKLLDAGLQVNGYVNSTGDGALVQTRNTTASSATEGGKLRLICDDEAAMGDDHRLGVIEFQGAEDASNNRQTGARIQAMCDANWSASENGTRLEFYTMDGNAASELSLTLDSNLLATFAGAVTVTGTITGSVTGNVTGDVTGSVEGNVTGDVTGNLTGRADTVATIAGLAPNTATTQATQAAITTCANLVTVGTIGTGVWNGTAIATDQQKHLATFDIRGYSTADGTNYEIPVFVTDNNAPFEHNTSVGSDGLTALTVTKLIKATGVVMPYAGTLKKWKGWATHSTTSGTCNIALFRYRPNASSASNVSLVLLDAVSHTPAANNTVIAIDETAFTDADIAAGDVIISGIKGDGSQVTYFVSTLEIEWD